MPLNKQRGNMYTHVTHTFNMIKGVCPHHCSYCLSGDTLITMSDLSMVPIKNIKIGDNIIGIKKSDTGYLSMVPAIVEATSKRVATAYEIKTPHTLVICSKNHKWLLERGIWRSLDTATNTGMHLKPGSKINVAHTYLAKLQPVGGLYKRGYLRGMILGDANFKKYQCGAQAIMRNGKNYIYSPHTAYKFRLALKDKEALIRTKEYLNFLGVKVFSHIHEGMDSIRKDGKNSFEKIQGLIQIIDSSDFWAGFLGGIFDAEGSFSTVMRITNKNPIVISEIQTALDFFGFQYSMARTHNGCTTFTLNGGFNEQLRFITVARPSITRKRKRYLSCLKQGHAEIQGIKEVGKSELFDIQTSAGNFIANGLVSHNCYMNGLVKRQPYFDRRELKTDLGSGNIIFVGSSIDMWAKGIRNNWINRVLEHCIAYPENTYLFQSKNPDRFIWVFRYPLKRIFATTIESNREYPDISDAPSVRERKEKIESIGRLSGEKTQVTIEPIMDFDTEVLVEWMADCHPDTIVIGADSKGHNLPEPSPEKVHKLIDSLNALSDSTIICKPNLERVLGGLSVRSTNTKSLTSRDIR